MVWHILWNNDYIDQGSGIRIPATPRHFLFEKYFSRVPIWILKITEISWYFMQKKRIFISLLDNVFRVEVMKWIQKLRLIDEFSIPYIFSHMSIAPFHRPIPVQDYSSEGESDDEWRLEIVEMNRWKF